MATIQYDPAGVFLKSGGIGRGDVADLAPRLEACRAEVLADAKLWAEGGKVPAEKDPLDAGYLEMPERLLDELKQQGAKSQLARLRTAADRLAGMVGSVVTLGIGGSYMGARALMDACCHKYFNEVEPAMRRGRPRMYFEGNNADSDATLDLLRLLQSRGDRWGIVVISKSGGTLEPAAAFRILLRELRASLGKDADKLSQYVIPVTGTSGKLFDLAGAIGCKDIFPVPDGVGGRYSVLSAVGLLPAALLGLDIEKLLSGAAAMNDHFRTAPLADNVVLNYVGVCHLMEEKQGCVTRVLSTWGKRLEGFGMWHDQLLSESLGKHERGALPLTVVNTRDLHSRGQQHQQGRRDKLITNLVIDQCQRDPLAIGRSDWDQDKLNELADKTLADVLMAALKGTNQAYGADNRPTADLHLPTLDEYTLGQLFQMLMLATHTEGRLIGINPFGQPGVEAYKKNMNAILRA